MGVVSKKLRDSARGQECTVRSSYCNHDPETTVLAHLPSEVKGGATKSDDWNACFACSGCHAALDAYRLPVRFYYDALQRTQKIWRDMGLIVIAGDNEKPRKPSAKIVQRSPLYARGD
jgi:putative nuclease YbcO-like protein